MGSDISWWKLCMDLSASKYVPFKYAVLFSFYQDQNLALMSPRIMVNKELLELILLRSSSKSDGRFSNSGLGTCRQHQLVILNKNAQIVLMEVQKKTWFFLFEIYFLGMVIHQSNSKNTLCKRFMKFTKSKNKKHTGRY